MIYVDETLSKSLFGVSVKEVQYSLHNIKLKSKANGKHPLIMLAKKVE